MKNEAIYFTTNKTDTYVPSHGQDIMRVLLLAVGALARGRAGEMKGTTITAIRGALLVAGYENHRDPEWRWLGVVHYRALDILGELLYQAVAQGYLEAK
jgi:hypothetical protein